MSSNIALDNENQGDAADQMFTPAYIRAFSPRSKEACHRQGIDPDELTFRPVSFFKTSEEVADKIAVARFKHNNRRRAELLELVRQEHQHLVSINWKPRARSVQDEYVEAKMAAMPTSPIRGKKSNSPHKGGHDDKGGDLSTEVRMEKERVARMQERQQKEIENMIAYEMKLTEKAAEHERKMQAQAKRDADEAQAEADRKKARQDAQREEQVRKLDKAAADARQALLDAYAQAEREQKEKEDAEAKEQARRDELQRLADERAAKQHAREMAANAQNYEKMMALQRKFHQMQLDEQARHEKLMASRAEQARLTAQRAAEAKAKVDLALATNEAVMEAKRQAVRDKMAYQANLGAANAVRDAERQRLHAEELAKKEAKRKLARDTAAEQLRKFNEETTQKQLDQLQRKKDEEERFRQENMVKEEEEELSRLEKLANVRRIARMEEYRRTQMIAKMNEDMSRAVEMEAQKRAMLQERKYSSTQTKMEKERLLNVFARLRQTGKSITADKIQEIAAKGKHGASGPQTPMAKSSSSAQLGKTH